MRSESINGLSAMLAEVEAPEIFIMSGSVFITRCNGRIMGMGAAGERQLMIHPTVPTLSEGNFSTRRDCLVRVSHRRTRSLTLDVANMHPSMLRETEFMIPLRTCQSSLPPLSCVRSPSPLAIICPGAIARANTFEESICDRMHGPVRSHSLTVWSKEEDTTTG